MTPAEAMLELGRRHLAKDVAAAAGVSDEVVWRWRTGRWTPSIEQAQLLDEALGAAQLVAAVRKARTRSCQLCGSTFLTKGRASIRLYCGDLCMQRAHREQKKASRARRNATRLEDVSRQLAIVRRAHKELRSDADEMCAQCVEGGLTCGLGACPLHRSTKALCIAKGCVVDHRKTAVA